MTEEILRLNSILPQQEVSVLATSRIGLENVKLQSYISENQKEIMLQVSEREREKKIHRLHQQIGRIATITHLLLFAYFIRTHFLVVKAKDFSRTNRKSLLSVLNRFTRIV